MVHVRSVRGVATMWMCCRCDLKPSKSEVAVHGPGKHWKTRANDSWKGSQGVRFSSGPLFCRTISEAHIMPSFSKSRILEVSGRSQCSLKDSQIESGRFQPAYVIILTDKKMCQRSDQRILPRCILARALVRWAPHTPNLAQTLGGSSKLLIVPLQQTVSERSTTVAALRGPPRP